MSDTGNTQAASVQKTEGERIAKIIARSGLCSRREAEDLIRAGRVQLNGQVILTPALDITSKDKILVDGETLPDREPPRLWRYHKPKGRVTTHKDPEGRPTVFEGLPEDLPRLISVGRLDFNTEGLLLLTNDGELARHLELPATGWARRYRVRAHGSATQDALDALAGGVTIDGVNYGPVEAAFERQQGGNVWLSVMIREGKNREIRRIMEHLGLSVNRLIRVSYGPFMLGDLEAGEIEEVRPRVLMDQLGAAMSAELGIERGPRRKTEDAPRERENRGRKPSGAKAYLTRKRDAPLGRDTRAPQGERGGRGSGAASRSEARNPRARREDGEPEARTRLRRVLPLDPASGEAVRFEEMPVRPPRRNLRNKSGAARDAAGGADQQRGSRTAAPGFRRRDAAEPGSSRRGQAAAREFDRPGAQRTSRPDDGDGRRDDRASERTRGHPGARGRERDDAGGRPFRSRDAEGRSAPARDRDRPRADGRPRFESRPERAPFRPRDRKTEGEHAESSRDRDEVRGARPSGRGGGERGFRPHREPSEGEARTRPPGRGGGARFRSRDEDGATPQNEARRGRLDRNAREGREGTPGQGRAREDGPRQQREGAPPRPGGRKTGGAERGTVPRRAGKSASPPRDRRENPARPRGKPKPPRER